MRLRIRSAALSAALVLALAVTALAGPPLLCQPYETVNARSLPRDGLRGDASPERVLIEIQDECGGLASGDVNELFRPFEQRSADRTGVGLGLAFSRWGAAANDGQIYARNLPGKGCVFTVDLPRHPVPALEVVQS